MSEKTPPTYKWFRVTTTILLVVILLTQLISVMFQISTAAFNQVAFDKVSQSYNELTSAYTSGNEAMTSKINELIGAFNAKR